MQTRFTPAAPAPENLHPQAGPDQSRRRRRPNACLPLPPQKDQTKTETEREIKEGNAPDSSSSLVLVLVSGICYVLRRCILIPPPILILIFSVWFCGAAGSGAGRGYVYRSGDGQIVFRGREELMRWLLLLLLRLTLRTLRTAEARHT
jgi:hypothetical protein